MLYYVVIAYLGCTLDSFPHGICIPGGHFVYVYMVFAYLWHVLYTLFMKFAYLSHTLYIFLRGICIPGEHFVCTFMSHSHTCVTFCIHVYMAFAYLWDTLYAYKQTNQWTNKQTSKQQQTTSSPPTATHLTLQTQPTHPTKVIAWSNKWFAHLHERAFTIKNIITMRNKRTPRTIARTGVYQLFQNPYKQKVNQ